MNGVSPNKLLNLAIVNGLFEGDSRRISENPINAESNFNPEKDGNEQKLDGIAWQWQVCTEQLSFLTSESNFFGPRVTVE